MTGKRSANEEDQRIGNLVRILRLKAGMSQTELGQAIGVTFQQVQKYEKGTNRIGSGKLVQVAAALGVQPQQFFTSSTRPATGAVDDVLQLLADSRNLRALVAFGGIRNAKVKSAMLDLMEQVASRR